ncbi:long-chain-fatty-acid--CoA ligase [Candidatus Moduliflexus flocculans]|uniref:Long-chain-fatty-acid--CoA ligase n=1 Tax=Candidatus Moduliflexus flocculans TaxID=1499966 RepID=A0A081BTK0_9BACT|nr:long-chain-fatty-acid--CoA ligase [Candidatus Moduliflexus flocculans]
MTLGEMLERSGEKYPDKIALVYKEQRVTYKQLNSDANRLGRALNALGVGSNDKVGVLMPNCPEFVMSVFAALKAGAVFVPLNGLLTGRELSYVVDNSDAKILIAAPPYDSVLAMLKPHLPKVEKILTLDDDTEEDGLIPFRPMMSKYDDSNLKPSVNLSDPAAIYYSSGTTGLPKGAMLSHVNILSSTVAIGKAVDASRRDVPLCCLPMFHTLAMTACVMVPIFAGMTNILLETFLPQPVLKGFSDWKVTIFVGVPTMFAVLANMPHLERYDISNFRLGYVGGAPITDAIVEKFESRFPAKLYEGYGLSECAPLVSVNPLGNRKIGSIGKTADRVTWKIADKNGKELPRNTVGEIIVSGPNVMLGYYNNEEATKEAIKGEDANIIMNESLVNYQKYGLPADILQSLTAFKNKKFTNENVFLATLDKRIGKETLEKYRELILTYSRQRWFSTGDLGYMDEDGFVFIADRKKDMIIVGGENVYPKEVENVLTQHPGVEDAGVIGIEDPIRGEVPKAYIVPKLGAAIDEKDILEFCRQHLAAYKVPRSIEVIDEIPKNITGKILKRTLRRIAAGLPPDEEDEDEYDEEVEEVEEVAPPVSTSPKPGGMSIEEQMRMLEGGGKPATPPAGGMSLEDQIRMLENGGSNFGGKPSTPTPPPTSGGMSIEEQMKMLEGGGSNFGGKAAAPTPPPRQQPTYTPPSGEGLGFDDHLRQLVMEIPGGIAGSIAGFDGIGITSFTNDPDFSLTVADAEVASIVGAVKKSSESLNAGDPQEVYFVTNRYGFLVKTIRGQYVVTLVIDANELNWGLMRVQINKIIPRIEAELF